MTCRPWSTMAFVAGLLTVAACDEVTPPTQPSVKDQALLALSVSAGNFWTAKARFPNGRGELVAGVADNAAGQPTLYIFGGQEGESTDAYPIQAYNLTTNRWSTPGWGFVEAGMNGVGNIKGKLYLSGGRATDGFDQIFSSELNVYDPVANTLVRKADMPRATADGVTGVIGDKLYVLAGTCSEDGFENCLQFTVRRFYRYNPVTNVWVDLPACPRFHRSGAGGVINGKLYVAGGYGRTGGPNANLDMYDPVKNIWTALAPMPEARGSTAGAVLQGKLYVIGGSGVNGTRKVYAYDPVTNTWSAKAPLLKGRENLAAAKIVLNGRASILAVGGWYNGYEAENGPNELYTP